MIKKYKIYRNYRSQDNSTKSCKNLYVGKGFTADRGYMNEQMKIHFDYFDVHQIEKFQEFVQPLYDYGCDTGNQKKFLFEFIKYMKVTKNIEIFLLKKREINKANSRERNILFNRLALEYPKDLITFLRKYLYQNYPDKINTENFIQYFQIKINKLINPSLKKAIIPPAPFVSFIAPTPFVPSAPSVLSAPSAPSTPLNDIDDPFLDQTEQNEIFAFNSNDPYGQYDLFSLLHQFD